MRRVLLGVLSFYSSGIICGFLWPQGGLYLFWPLLLGSGCYIYYIYRRPPGRPSLPLYLLILLCAWFHTANHWQAPRQLHPFLGRPVLWQGVVDDFPRVSNGRQQFTLRLEGIEEAGRWWQGRGKIRVTFDWSPQDGPEVAYGDNLLLKTPLRLPRRAGNPGEFCSYSYFTRLGMGATSFVEEPSQILQQRSGGGQTLWAWAYSLRHSMIDYWTELLPGPAGGLLISMATGAREYLTDDVERDFSRSGLGHLLSVSGIHVGLVGLFIRRLASLLRLPPKIRPGFIFLGMLFYVLASGGRPSAWRALIMACGGILIPYLQRRVDLMSLWTLAALLLLIHNPLQLGEIGFQLSFTATWFLINLLPYLERLLPSYLAACIAVQLGVLPLMAYHFGQVAGAGFIANPLAVPLAGFALAFGLLTWLVGSILPTIGSLLAYPLAWLLRLLIIIAQGTARLPLYWEPAAPNPLFLLLYYLCLGYCFYAEGKLTIHRLGQRVIRYRQLVAIGLCLTFFVWSGYWRANQKDLRITFIDVGQGNAILLEFPQKKTMLIDGGGRPYTDVGANILLPFLRHQGIRRIDVLVCTHPHEDHYLGLITVLENLEVGQIIDNGQRGPRSSYGHYRRLVEEGEYIQGRAGLVVEIGGGRLKFLHPPENPLVGTGSDVNNNSLVGLLAFQGVEFLVTGDLDRAGQEFMLARQLVPQAQLFQFPHHGSINAFVPPFIGAVNPELVVIPVGLNSFGQPAGAIIDAFAEGEIPLWRTDRDGAVTITLRKGRYRVSSYLNRWWRRNWLAGVETS
ncbi:MAG: DNA internalization-related competence protein ComEC/Rec2 [Limnochordia bacterium]|jgi:competence protein ComEC